MRSGATERVRGDMQPSVITGLGIVTALGDGLSENLAAAKAGTVGIAPFDPEWGRGAPPQRAPLRSSTTVGSPTSASAERQWTEAPASAFRLWSRR